MPPKLASQLVFERWTQRQAGGPRKLSARSAGQYHLIWDSWLRYLAGEEVTWDSASPAHVANFLASVRSARNPTEPASSVTRARYTRLLNHVYQFAVAEERCRSNPAAPSPGRDRPTEAMESLAFHPVQWRQLLHGLDEELPEHQRLENGAQWQHARNRLILLLMMEVALTAGEIVRLNVQSVRHPTWRQKPSGALLQVPAAGRVGGNTAAVAAEVEVSGSRRAQSRTISLPARTTAALREYLAVRPTYIAASGVRRSSVGMIDLTLPDAPLLLSQKRGRKGGTESSRLTERTLHPLAREHVRACLGELFSHNGPAVLRNSCIVRWLESDIAPEEIVKRAGFKDIRSLERLRPHALSAL
jgi:integrase